MLPDDQGGTEDYSGDYVGPSGPLRYTFPGPDKLSTIYEMSEEGGQWPSRQELLAPRPPPSTPSTSSYGQILRPVSSYFGPDPDTPVQSVLSTIDYGQPIGLHWSISRLTASNLRTGRSVQAR